MTDPRNIPRMPKNIEERDELMARIYGAERWERHLAQRKRLAMGLRSDPAATPSISPNGDSND